MFRYAFYDATLQGSFLNDNNAALDDAFKSLYVWDNDQNKYVPVSEVDATDRSLPPGQGFFVFMKTGQTEITFNETKRSTKPVSGDTGFSKNTDTTPNIVLSVSDNSTTVNTDIKYFENATQGLDPGYDIGNFNGASLDVFTHLLENSNDTNFSIQSLPKNNYENMIIPIGVKATKDNEIAFSATALNLPSGIDIYIEDKEKNVFFKLEDTLSYKVTLENNVNGIGRFYLHTTSKSLSTKDTSELIGVHVFATNKVLKIQGLQEGKASIRIYTVVGKEVLETNFQAHSKTEIQLPKVSSGVYFIKLETQKGKLTKKIVID